jgi:Trk K+ transport system NAD-binding subunit
MDAVVSGVGLLAGGVALGLGISLMSAFFIERRLVEATQRRARRLRRHVVVVGLPDVGLRIAQLLERLGVQCAVLDTSSATERESRSLTRRLSRAPVIAGDLEVGLRAVGVHRASSLIATSEDNLLNVEACLRAKRATRKQIRTIARIFDDVNAERGAKAFGVDKQIAAVTVAAPTFVEAALADECVRTFGADEHAMAALRWPTEHPVGSGQMRRWYDEGVRLLAVWQPGDGAAPPDAEIAAIGEDQAAVLVGPEAAIKTVTEELRRRAPADPVPMRRLAAL